MKEYSNEFSEKSFWDKLKVSAKSAGIKVVYAGLLLFYALQKKDIPVWAKGIIIGALGYFILPIDAIPDMTPIAGYTDDIGALLASIGMVAVYIDGDVKEKAKDKLKDWFGEFDENDIDGVA